MVDFSRAVNAPGITGLAHNSADGILYISTVSGDVLRWDPTSGSFLAPIHVGGHQSSIAVSPDGAYLLLGSADQTIDSGGVAHGEIDRVRLSDFTVTPLGIPFTSNYPNGTASESGVSDLAIANTGETLVTTIGYSGFNPLREFQFSASAVGSQTVSGIPFPAPGVNGVMASSEDGRYVLISGWGLNLYDAATDTIVATKSAGGSTSADAVLAVSDKASLILDGGQVFDLNFNAVENLGSAYSFSNISGGQFSQDGSKLYILDADHEQVRVFDTSSWLETGDIQLSAGALRQGYPEEITASADGRFLFFRTTAGFDSIDLTSSAASAPAAPPKSAPTSQLWSGQVMGFSPFGPGATTISADDTIAAGQTVTGGFVMTDPTVWPALGPSLFINGSLNVSSAVTGAAVGAVLSAYSGDFRGSIVQVGSTGELLATATGLVAYAFGFDGVSFSPRVENDGLWSVSATLAAYGVANLEVPNAPGPEFVNRGTFQVSAPYAYGVTAPYDLKVVNDGHFSVAGATQAVGVRLSGAGPYSLFTNTGDFTVTGPAGGSIGILIQGGSSLPILNSGIISADVAIQVANATSPPQTPFIDLTNSGTINGAINLGSNWAPNSDYFPHGAPGSHIVNTGEINGAIHFDDGNDVYEGSGGTLTGGIYLGSGTDHVVLGNDGESVYGGSGFENIVGGTGADTLVAGDGDSTFDGGAGVDTLAFSGDASAYTVRPSGAGYTIFGPLGAAISLSNVEVLQFADQQMVLGPAGETLTARGGGDTLMGGPGDDTLHGGAGADTASYATAASGVSVSLSISGAQNTGGAGADSLSGIENLTGSAFDDRLAGDGGDNDLTGGKGSDSIDGGTGNDTAVYSGARSSYSVVRAGLSTIVTDLGSGFSEGTDTLANVEHLKFADQTDIVAPTAGNDLTGDGKADILWRSASNGDVYLFTSSPNAVAAPGQDLGLMGANWHVDQVADFTGDGKVDILWRNSSDGDSYLWTSSANAVAAPGIDLGVVELQWQVQAAADFNGDGKADILWRNLGNGDAYLFTSSANAVAAPGQDLGVVGLQWHVQAAADFDGDGKADILWRNYGNGDVYLWTSSGNPIAAAGQDLGMVELQWRVQAVADFNGDGKADILWRNRGNGDVYVFTSSANGVAAPGVDLGVVELQWQVQDAADFNGDGKADILWRNMGNGDAYLWTSSGAGIAAPGQDLGIVPLNWQVIAPTIF